MEKANLPDRPTVPELNFEVGGWGKISDKLNVANSLHPTGTKISEQTRWRIGLGKMIGKPIRTQTDLVSTKNRSGIIRKNRGVIKHNMS